MEIFQIVGLALIATVLSVMLKDQKPEIALQISIAAGAIIFILMVFRISTVIFLLQELAKKVNIDFAPATVQRYSTLSNHVTEFLKYNYKKPDMYLSELNYKFISDFEHYFKTVRHCNHNSTIKYIRNLRKIINIALANEWLLKDPFMKFKG